MTAQPIEDGLKHGTATGYWQHYSRGVAMCKQCRAAATAYGRVARETSKRAREVDARIVVPVGWPCPDCVWSPRIKVSDGRIISWRLECCKKHRGYW